MLCLEFADFDSVTIGDFVFVMFHFRTKRLGLVLKSVVLVFLPLPLILWPIVGVIGSLLGGIGYGFFVPLIATFEAVGGGITDKLFHCVAVSSFSCFGIWYIGLMACLGVILKWFRSLLCGKLS